MQDGAGMEERQNNFGALRLCFAAAVILSHSPQELYGNFSREPLVQLFHTISLGDVAVAGFFIISGYLVTASFLASASVGEYFLKRALRIYPAFLGASLLCVLVAAPLVSPGILSRPDVPAGMLVFDALTLTPPGGSSEFSRLPWSMLNVPMWTIAYDARCYIFVAIAGTFGLLARRHAMLGLTILLLAVREGLVFFSQPLAFTGPWRVYWQTVFLDPNTALYLLGLFCTGVTYRLYPGLRFKPIIALFCGASFLAWLAVPDLAQLGLAVFFPYTVFWAAFCHKFPYISKVGRKIDLSYGLYLTAWPISWLIVIHHPGIGPYSLTIATLLCALPAAFISWHLIEAPALGLKYHLLAVLTRLRMVRQTMG